MKMRRRRQTLLGIVTGLVLSVMWMLAVFGCCQANARELSGADRATWDNNQTRAMAQGVAASNAANAALTFAQNGSNLAAAALTQGVDASNEANAALTFAKNGSNRAEEVYTALVGIATTNFTILDTNGVRWNFSFTNGTLRVLFTN